VKEKIGSRENAAWYSEDKCRSRRINTRNRLQPGSSENILAGKK
jgi:hypothetical protein